MTLDARYFASSIARLAKETGAIDVESPGWMLIKSEKYEGHTRRDGVSGHFGIASVIFIGVSINEKHRRL